MLKLWFVALMLLALPALAHEEVQSERSPDVSQDDPIPQSPRANEPDDRSSVSSHEGLAASLDALIARAHTDSAGEEENATVASLQVSPSPDRNQSSQNQGRNAIGTGPTSDSITPPNANEQRHGLIRAPSPTDIPVNRGVQRPPDFDIFQWVPQFSLTEWLNLGALMLTFALGLVPRSARPGLMWCCLMLLVNSTALVMLGNDDPRRELVPYNTFLHFLIFGALRFLRRAFPQAIRLFRKEHR